MDHAREMELDLSFQQTAGPPSADLRTDVTTAILVVATMSPDLCASCDEAVNRLDEFPEEWNRVVTAITDHAAGL